MSTIPAEYCNHIPDSLRAPLEHIWEQWLQSDHPAEDAPQFTSEVYSLLCKVWACSEFAAQLSTRRPEVLRGLIEEGIQSPRELSDYRRLVAEAIAQSTAGFVDAATAETTLMRGLRILRQREMLRIVLRDIGELAELEQILRELSELAEAMIS